MHLGDIFDDLDFTMATAGIEITAVEIDSRRCAPGVLFFALDGQVAKGIDYVADAVANGASAVVVPAMVSCSVPVIVIPPSRLRAALAHACAAVTGRPDREVQLVGITGTNGKTSVATLVASLCAALGWHGDSIGTLTQERTTPAAPELWRTLRALRTSIEDSAKHVVALEVSSHALDQDRVLGAHFAVAAFTNLTHDHLDYHETMEQYFAAKARLFTSENASRAVIWVDDPYGRRLADACTLPAVEVRRSDASQVASTLSGTSFLWRGWAVSSPLIGDYNVDNALLAMAIVVALGASEESVANALRSVTAVPGRFEVVHDDSPTVIVDYAHSPDGLERVLHAVRALSSGRVITVFGCGGDRDRAKRPRMGEVATSLSDYVIVTSDNPRSEDPEQIIDEVLSTVPAGAAQRIVDRAEAIASALSMARDADVVLIAGKGHETTQSIGDQVLAFDDRLHVREILK